MRNILKKNKNTYFTKIKKNRNTCKYFFKHKYINEIRNISLNFKEIVSGYQVIYISFNFKEIFLSMKVYQNKMTHLTTSVLRDGSS